MGNKADVSGNDLLSWWAEDDATSVGLLYLESFGNPRKFARLARDLSRSKPVIAVKSGRSAVGRRAASSHTAALASSDEAVAALFHQTGVIRVDTIEELFDVAQVVEAQPLAQGLRVAVLEQRGRPGRAGRRCVREQRSAGPGVLRRTSAPDRRPLPPERRRQQPDRPRGRGQRAHVRASPRAPACCLTKSMQSWSISPRRWSTGGPTRSPPPSSPPWTGAAAAADAGALDESPQVGKPVVASLLGADESGQAILRSARYPVPSYTYPETAVRALAHALRYAAWRARPSGTVPVLADVDVNEARRRLPHQEVGGA